MRTRRYRRSTTSRAAVLAREEVVRYLQRRATARRGAEARERIHAYLDELRTTQRLPDLPRAAAPALPDPPQDRAHRRAHRSIVDDADAQPAASSTPRTTAAIIDYLVEPLVLDDNGIRPPLIAAGINLFGGPLGLIHRHVTGAIPIRRNTKDPAYLITLKAYVAEILKKHDLFFYHRRRTQLQRRAEGAEDRPDARRAAGRAAATWSSSRRRLPTTWCSRTSSSRGRGSRSVAAAVRARVGRDGPLRRRLPLARVRRRSARRSPSTDATRRRAATSSTWRIGSATRIGASGQSAADRALRAPRMRPSITRREAGGRAPRRSIDKLRAATRQPRRSPTGARPSMSAAEPLETRGIIVIEQRTLSRPRTQRAALLRADDRAPAAGASGSDPLMLDAFVEGLFHPLSQSGTLKRLASRYGMSGPRASRAASSPARRSREAIDGRARRRGARPARRRSTTSARASRLWTKPTPPRASTLTMIDAIVAAGIGRNISLKLTQLGLDVDEAQRLVDNLRTILEPRAARTGSSCGSTWRTRPTPIVTLDDLRDAVARRATGNVGVVLQSALHRSEAGSRARDRARRARAPGEGRVQGTEAVAYQQRRPTSTRPSCG